MPHENHRRHHRRDPEAEPLTTIVSLVYVTASKTFDGPIAGYTTLDSRPSDTITSYWISATVAGQVVSWQTTQTIGSVDAATTTPSTSSPAITTESSVAGTSVNSRLSADSSSVILAEPSTTLATSQTSVLVASLHSTTSAATSKTPTLSNSLTASADTASSSSTSGLSGHAVAGLSVGIVLIIVTAIGCAAWFFCHRKIKRDKENRTDRETEKPTTTEYNGMLAAPRRAPSNATAPQLNAIRPITEFSPNFSGHAENTAKSGPPTPRPNSPPRSQWERNISEKQDMDRQNPFGTHAAATSNENNQANPFGNHAATANGTRVLEGAATAGAANTAYARRSISQDVPKPLDLSRSSPSPVNGMATSPATAARLAAGKAPVHRVLLDFAPSMDDEVRLCMNDLVRLVNAYDDGWCYVSCLNRPEQGVCPRSCLSHRPIPPRSSRSPQQGRPMTPTQGRPGPQSPAPSQSSGMRSVNTPSPMRPMAPGQARPMTPGSGGQSHAAMSGAPRPMSPASIQSDSPAFRGPFQGRPMSPGPNDQGENRPRSPPVSQNQGGRKSPPGSSPTDVAVSTTSLSSPIRGESSSSVVDTTLPSPSSTSAPVLPPDLIAQSQILLPTTPVGRKPVPGQAM